MSYDIAPFFGEIPRRRHHREHGPESGHGPHREHRHRRGGRHELGSGRKFSSADLQLVLLALLEKNPSHGYELIKSLEELSDGFYVPSPGMIYPSLTYLEEVGQANVEVEGSKKRYDLTESGRDHLTQNRERAQAILDDLAKIGARMEETRRAFAGKRSREEDSKPDDLLALLKQRRSMGLSRMKPDPVDRKIIERMLEAANWAPSHEDTEPWRFTVFEGAGRERLAAIFEAAHRMDHPEDPANDGPRKRAFAAPLWISIGMSPKLREDGTLLMTEDEELMAVACAAQNLHLMAQASGLVGMWHSKGISVHPAVAEALGIESPARLLGFFMCGWPNQEPGPGQRRPIAEKITWA